MPKVQSKAYCAFCKNQRHVNTQKHLGMQGVLSAFLLGSAISLIVWQSIDPRGLGFVLIFLVSWECFAHLKYRLGMICPYCAFDPILYRKSPEAACAKVKSFMDERKKDPMFYLSSKGYDKLARRKVSEKKQDIKMEVQGGSGAILDENTFLSNESEKTYPSELSQVEKDLLNMPPV